MTRLPFLPSSSRFRIEVVRALLFSFFFSPSVELFILILIRCCFSLCFPLLFSFLRDLFALARPQKQKRRRFPSSLLMRDTSSRVESPPPSFLSPRGDSLPTARCLLRDRARKASFSFFSLPPFSRGWSSKAYTAPSFFFLRLFLLFRAARATAFFLFFSVRMRRVSLFFFSPVSLIFLFPPLFAGEY